jgi:beta-lactamase class D
MRIIITLLAGFIFQAGYSQNQIVKDFKKHFEKYGVEGCFVLYNQSAREFIRYNPDYCDSAYSPASTFKIPNSVIAIEEGIIKDTSQVFKWDGNKWHNDNWNQDQNLKTAMKYSCIWVYIDIAKKVGVEKYRNYLNLFNYGNKDLSGPADHFWLEGPFAISANQQIDFLRKFYNYQLAVSKKAIDMVKDVIVLEKTDSYKLSGKTGSGSSPEGVMWLVGYVEKDGKPYFFAMNFMTNDFAGKKQARYDITKDILRELKLIE